VWWRGETPDGGPLTRKYSRSYSVLGIRIRRLTARVIVGEGAGGGGGGSALGGAYQIRPALRLKVVKSVGVGGADLLGGYKVWWGHGEVAKNYLTGDPATIGISQRGGGHSCPGRLGSVCGCERTRNAKWKKQREGAKRF